MNQDELFLEKLRQIVVNNLENEQFGVTNLARKSNISRSHLHRRLKSITGQSISQFIREIRLQISAELLQKDQFTISEIAYKVGFGSPSYYIKCFQNYYGFPPKEWRSKIQTTSDAFVPVTKDERNDAKRINVSKISLIVIFLAIIVFIFYQFEIIPFKSNNHPKKQKSIAVLPFTNLSNDAENQFFADGIVEDMLNRLSTVEDFKVISRTSSEVYRNRKDLHAPEIGKELGVYYLVEGSVQLVEGVSRITIQLIDAKQDNHIWIKTFEREMNDIFSIQSDIALQVATSIDSLLTKQEAAIIEKDPTDNLKAYEWYQLGKYHWSTRTIEGLNLSINYFQKSIDEDPQYALPYAYMADAYFLKFLMSPKHVSYTEQAKRMGVKALEIDHRLAEAYNVMGGIESFINMNWEEAEKMFQIGLKYNPNHSNLMHRYSEHLNRTGRKELARTYLDKALEINPLSFIIRLVSSNLYASVGDYESALIDLNLCHELVNVESHPRTSDHAFEIYYNLGMIEELLQNSKAWAKEQFDGDIPENTWDSIYEKEGLKGIVKFRAEKVIVSPMKANFYAMVGEEELAIDILENLELSQKHELRFLLKFYSYRKMYKNERFQQLLAETNLPWTP